MTKPEFKWVPSEACNPPHRVSRPEQVEQLRESISSKGWNGHYLVGYQLNNRIQLLSGTHRHAAAAKVPVVVWPESTIRESWGDLKKWNYIMHYGDRE